MIAVKIINRIEDETSLKSERKGHDMKKQIMELLDDAGKAKLTELLGDKDIIVNDGTFIPRDRLNSKIEELKELQEQLGERDKQLKEISGKVTDNDELSKRINELQSLNETQKTEYETKLQKQTFDFALDKKLSEYQPKNKKAVKALLDMEQIKLDGDKLLGIDDQIEAIKTSDAYLFGETVVKGNNPPKAPNPQNLTNKAKLIEQYNEAEKRRDVAAMFGIEAQIKKLKE